MSPWRMSHRADPAGAAIADRHYNRQAVGAPQFVPPGRCHVLVADPAPGRGTALWVTSWPLAEFVRHEWAGAWINSTFRNEGAGLSSVLILAAIASTLVRWPEPPALGIVTFVDVAAVRRKRDPGRCYLRAGFEVVGRTKTRGLLAMQLPPDRFPPPCPARGQAAGIFEPAA